MDKMALQRAVQANCDLSDARDSGIYSICTLVLKLRNHYKWEKGLNPWDEPESAVLLDWIAAKEEGWEEICQGEFQDLPTGSGLVAPYEVEAINRALAHEDLFYGAGYGRSMKAVFFLAEEESRLTVAGCPVTIVGREWARELASPFATLQDGMICLRRQAMAFYFWDQIQEIRCSGKLALERALDLYGVLGPDGTVDRTALVERFDDLIAREMMIFVYHEVGEYYETALPGHVLKKIISAYPASPIELVARALKDILADTNEKGLLHFIMAAEQESSLAFYMVFLDGLRKVLFPELGPAFKEFGQTGDWQVIGTACRAARKANQARAAKFVEIAHRLDHESSASLKIELEREILAPLGIHRP